MRNIVLLFSLFISVPSYSQTIIAFGSDEGGNRTSTSISKLKSQSLAIDTANLKVSCFLIYPTITEDKVWIEFENTVELKSDFLKVVNSKVSHIDINIVAWSDSKYEVDLSSQPSGIYYFIILHNKKQTLHKVIKI